MRAYIGEADCVKDRINQSAEDRAFWETAVIITTSDEALTKGHVRYLEARLIEVAEEAGRVKLDNGQSPQSDRRRLPEAIGPTWKRSFRTCVSSFLLLGLTC